MTHLMPEEIIEHIPIHPVIKEILEQQRIIIEINREIMEAIKHPDWIIHSLKRER